MFAGGIDIHSYVVHHTFNSLLQTLSQTCLIDVVLVLPYANRLGINLNQFSQRIHQSSANGYGSTYSHILIRKLLSCYLACRINRCTTLADYKHLWYFMPYRFQCHSHHLLRLTRCCSVTDSDSFNLVLCNELLQSLGRCYVVDKHHGVV